MNVGESVITIVPIADNPTGLPRLSEFSTGWMNHVNQGAAMIWNWLVWEPEVTPSQSHG